MNIFENPTVIAAFIGGGVGSSLTFFFTLIKERFQRKQHGTYLAVRIICILDEYTDKCVEVVEDDGTIMGQSDKEGFYIPQVRLPEEPQYPDDIDWKSIDFDLMYQILNFPNAIKSANKYINFIGREIASPPDFEELFDARWDAYIDLGLKSIELASLLRIKYGFPEENLRKWNSDWNPKEYLEKKKQEIEAHKAK